MTKLQMAMIAFAISMTALNVCLASAVLTRVSRSAAASASFSASHVKAGATNSVAIKPD